MQGDLFPRVSLVEELCRVLDSSRDAMLCAMSHKQVRVDGHLVLPQHEHTWSEPQLAGRMAMVNGRRARLFNASRSAADNDRTQDAA